MTNGSPLRRPTLRDVAHAAGVSVKTASRVVNGEDGVSGDLVERVGRAIAELRYLPDERARTLRRSDARPTSIGFAMSDVSNPFFSAILRGLEDVARQHGCLVLSASSDGDPARQRQLVETFLQRRVAGIVLVPCGDDMTTFSRETLLDTPLVFLDCEPREHPYDSVRTDHHGGAVAMTRLLVGGGHRAIAFVGDDPSISSARLRYEGFCAGMAEAGLAIRPELVLRASHTPDVWQREVRALLTTCPAVADDAPTALFAAQNFATIGAVRALHELGREHEVALVGFDDVELGDVVQPGISVYAQQPQELGRRAGELLFQRIGVSATPPAREVIAGSLVGRGSGEITPTPARRGHPAAGAGTATRRRSVASPATAVAAAASAGVL